MAVCETCGNDYYLAFEVHTVGGVHTFDSFECAIHMLAPVCEHCGTKIVGHGAEVSGRFYCSAHCARTADAAAGYEIRDAVGAYPG
ncbi:Prokaryotic metallothionein [Dactylosporangium sp. AC04546]|uniref:Prokaryotic metallothionein n=1 Tax=Dactylosporangium sp. AC04546 TaxID=2862460 RepID=UPI001EDF70E1|nr:Prokaryotic metallothionein [Dactylosporangium sp. AC04546]WVK78230.1 Prokaryotic metallothionein [Dactylosporangium sp. AC04546]